MKNENPHVLLVIPIYNEEKIIENTVRETIKYLNENTKYSYILVVADNASTDSSPEIVKNLQKEIPFLEYVRLPKKGRGLALHTVWKDFNAEVVAYMDADLSSPLTSLPNIIDPILNNESDVTFGSRLLPPGQAINRKGKRELTSQGYNFLLQFILGATFKDAQCGFKAISKEKFNQVEEEIKNQNWFYDTELLLISQYKGLRLKEVPITWVDDPDSSVKVFKTIVENLKEMGRVYFTYRPESVFIKLFKFAIIGVLSTVGTALLFFLLRFVLDPQLANIVSLSTATILNTIANKRFAFKNKTKDPWGKTIIISAISFLLFWIPTAGSLWLLHNFFGVEDNYALETFIVMVASFFGTLMKFIFFSIIYKTKPTQPVI